MNQRDEQILIKVLKEIAVAEMMMPGALLRRSTKMK